MSLDLVDTSARRARPCKRSGEIAPLLVRSRSRPAGLQRYDLLCQKLVKEQLYTTASVLGSPSSAASTGEYMELSPMTGLKTFVTTLAGHAAAQAARLT